MCSCPPFPAQFIEETVFVLCLFILLMPSFDKKVLLLMKFNLLIYHFRFNIYCAMFLRNVCLPQSHEDTVLDFLLESLLLYFPLMYL